MVSGMTPSWWRLFNILTVADFLVLPTLIMLITLFAIGSTVFLRFKPQHRLARLHPGDLAIGMVAGYVIGWVFVYALANAAPSAAMTDERSITPDVVLTTLRSSALLWGGLLVGAWRGFQRGAKRARLREQR